MNKYSYFSSFSKIIFASILSVLASSNILSQEATFLTDAASIELENLKEGVETQMRIDRIDDQRTQLVSEYRETLKQYSDLESYNEHLKSLIKSQEQEQQSINSQIHRITGLERDVVPLMKGMLDTLEQFIELDTPFLLDERRRRIEKLRTLINDAKITKSEKYRRILEAYQIENDYGRHIETYEGAVGDKEGAQIVKFLKVGRVSFMYQTMDGKESFFWDKKINPGKH